MDSYKKHRRVLLGIYWTVFVIFFGASIAYQFREDLDPATATGLLFLTPIPFYFAYTFIRIHLYRVLIHDAVPNDLRTKYKLTGTSQNMAGDVNGQKVDLVIPKRPIEEIKLHASIPLSTPHIFIDAIHYENATYKSTHANYPERYHIQLEGDFNEKLKLYADEKWASHVLDIVSPDFMQLLIDSSTKFDVEIRSGSIQMFAPGTAVAEDSTLSSMLAAMELLLKNVEVKARVYQKNATFKPMQAGSEWTK